MIAVQQAYNHLRAFLGHVAAVVGIEVCSTSYFLDDELETAVANAIFSDGAGAMILACDGPGPRILGTRTLVRPEYLDLMGFTFPRGRQRILLSKDIRHVGAEMMGELVAEILQTHGFTFSDVRHWVLHSAGVRVLEQAQRHLGLTDADLAASRAVLRRFGNMSSATVLFVLREVLEQRRPQPGDRGLMIALGPGFAAEGAVLQW
jgi:alkylresorcinol/alkylpyrone synthase